MTKWFPISTAPKDGTQILAWEADEAGLTEPGGFYTLVCWNGHCFCDYEGYGQDSTHWMPLPGGPDATSED